MEWVLSKLPLKPTSINLLYSSSQHGWAVTEWRSRCLQRGPTITLMKSTKGKISGGYLHIRWNSGSELGVLTRDENCFIFNVDQKLILLATSADRAVSFSQNKGPAFGCNSLTVQDSQMMNAPNNCNCYTDEKYEFFKVPKDPQGNSILTGDGSGQQFKKFTLAALETWLVNY